MSLSRQLGAFHQMAVTAVLFVLSVTEESIMQVRYFGYPGNQELNLIGRVWNFRIAHKQIALWRNYRPLFDFCWR